jgi:hypothetical protein
MLKKISREELITLTLLSVFFIVFLILTSLSETTYGGADDIVHYRFARYAYKYPHLLLDHWAKPLFTLLSSPFAQMGFFGMKLFNLFIGLGASYLTYRVCQQFSYRNNFLVLFFICFTPVYLSMLFSGMTEILFGFTLILVVFLALRGNILWSAIVLSFLPFVRNEGIVVFPCFLAYYLLYRKFWSVPLLLTGFVIYSLAGAGYYHDIFWVITKMPYTGAKDIYGSGELLHFVNSAKTIFGIPLAVLFCIGLFVFFLELVTKKSFAKKLKESIAVKEVLLILVPFFAYFITHSILWWKGWGGSLGLTRVMAGVVPLFAVVCMKGMHGILELIYKKRFKVVISAVIIYFAVMTPFNLDRYPVSLGDTRKVIRKASFWVKENGYLQKRVYFYDHYFWFFLGLNPFDPDIVWEKLPDDDIPSKDVPDSCVVIWDAHFAANDGRMPLEKLMKDSLMRLLKVFRPARPLQVMGGHNYEVCIFQKTSKKSDIRENDKTYQSVSDSISYSKSIKVFDFEKQSGIDEFVISDSLAHTGKYSCLMRKKNEFGPTVTFQFKDFDYENLINIKACCWVWAESKERIKEAHLTASVQHGSRLYFYQSMPIDTTMFEVYKWNKTCLLFTLPEAKSKKDIIKIYLWNKGKEQFFIDDFSILIGK